MTVKFSTMAGGANTFAPSFGPNKREPLKIEFDASAEDEEGYHVLKSIPIFDGHNGEEEGLDDVDFTEELLHKIAQQCNDRVEDTGDMCPITDQHTSDDGPEPAVIGWAHNFQVKPFGKKNPRPTIHADFKIHKSNMDKVKSLPRRSIELWPDMVIDPLVLKAADKPAIDSVALLGAQRPARDLGLLFSKNSNGKAKYNLEEEHMNPEELIKQCYEAMCNTPQFKFVEELMSKTQAAEQEQEQYGEEEAMQPKPDQEEDADVGVEEGKDEKLEPAKLRMRYEQERRKSARLESDYKVLFAKVEEIERRERIANRKADLLSLEGEGFDFDLADELEYVQDMEPTRYSKHLNKIKTRYRKAPIGVNITPARVPAEGGAIQVAANPADVYAALGNYYKPTKTMANKPGEGN